MTTPQDIIGFKFIFSEVLSRLNHLQSMAMDFALSENFSVRTVEDSLIVTNDSDIVWTEMYAAHREIEKCRQRLNDIFDSFEDDFLNALEQIQLDDEYRDEVS